MPATDLLDLYIEDEKSKPFAWGQENGDCLLFLLGWTERCGRTSPSSWRGAYACEAEAKALLAAAGGAVVAVTETLGTPRIGSPAARGDVGLLSVDDWHLGMICTGSMWVLRAGTRGVRLTRSAPEIIWDMRLQ
jgi:hypothetical protein